MSLYYWPLQHKDYSQQSEKCTGDDYPCIICGRPCPNPKWMIHIHSGGGVAVTEQEAEELNDPGADLGLYPIGANCLNKHPELKMYAQRSDK